MRGSLISASLTVRNADRGPEASLRPLRRAQVSRSRIALLAVLGLVSGAVCSDDGARPAPQAPGPDPIKLSGRVRLVSELFDETNQPAGSRIIEDATGVVVRLLDSTGTAVDSVATVDGLFEFAGLARGTYRACAMVVLPNQAMSGDCVVEDRDVSVSEPLVLAGCGDLHTYPNPAHPEGIGIEFTAHGAQTYTVEVRSIEGVRVWTFSQEAPAGYYHVHWAGHDMTDHHVPGGAYWIVARVDGEESCRLVFWPGDEQGDEGHCGHIEADGLLVQHHDEVLATCWRGACAGSLDVAAGGRSHGLDVRFLDADSTAFAVADTCAANRMSWTVADTTVATLEAAAGSKWGFRVLGRRAGTTQVVLHAWHEEHIHFDSPPIPIVVE